MALRDLTTLFFHVSIGLFLGVIGPVALIYGMVELRILFWPTLVGLVLLLILVAGKLTERPGVKR